MPANQLFSDWIAGDTITAAKLNQMKNDLAALASADFTALTVGGSTVWHAGNDGAGSGLDADTLDGQQLTAILTSTALTGTPTAPTAAGGTNTTQVATTAFVQSVVGGAGAGVYATSLSYSTTGTGTNNEDVSFTNSSYDSGIVNTLSSATPITTDSAGLWWIGVQLAEPGVSSGSLSDIDVDAYVRLNSATSVGLHGSPAEQVSTVISWSNASVTANPNGAGVANAFYHFLLNLSASTDVGLRLAITDPGGTVGNLTFDRINLTAVKIGP